MDSVLEELRELKDQWTWKDSNLKFAGIGNPKILISNILRTGIFVPYVPPRVIKKNNPDLAELQENDDLFSEENQHVLEPAG